MSNNFTIAVSPVGQTTATLVTGEGEIVTVAGPEADGTGGHPNYRRIVNALVNDEDPTPFLSVSANLAALDDERVTIKDGQVIFNGQIVHSNITRKILRYQTEGRDTTNLLRFMERLDANPSFRSREQLFTWTEAQDLVIDADGYIIGYKGVNQETRKGDDGEDLTFLVSKHAGGAYVDGVWVDGHVPNDPGCVVSMDRAQVQDDPNVACSHGLHVGSFKYAKSWAPVLLEVRIDPADVVSVPTDSNGQKMRCCRYEVIGIHEDEDDNIQDKHEPEGDGVDQTSLDALEGAGVPGGFMESLRARFRRN